MAGNTTRPGQSVTARALALLGAFDVAHPRLSLSEMAHRADLPLATTHRLAGELEAWRALDRDDDGYYRIGEARGPPVGADHLADWCAPAAARNRRRQGTSGPRRTGLYPGVLRTTTTPLHPLHHRRTRQAAARTQSHRRARIRRSQPRNDAGIMLGGCLHPSQQWVPDCRTRVRRALQPSRSTQAGPRATRCRGRYIPAADRDGRRPRACCFH